VACFELLRRVKKKKGAKKRQMDFRTSIVSKKRSTHKAQDAGRGTTTGSGQWATMVKSVLPMLLLAAASSSCVMAFTSPAVMPRLGAGRAGMCANRGVRH